MAAFTDFLDLRSAVYQIVGRTDLNGWFPMITEMAENWLDHNLRMREQVTSTTLTVVSGVATLPTNFVEMIGVYNAFGQEYIAQPLQNTRMASQRDYWSISGTTFKTKGPDGAYAIEYYAELPTLTSTPSTSNWLLARYPSLYLYAVATEAAKWIKDVDLAMAMGQLRDGAMRDAMMADNSARYSRVRVRVGGVTP